MSTITTNDGAVVYSELPNRLVKAGNGVDYAYRDTGTGASGAVPLVLLQHFRGIWTAGIPRIAHRLGIVDHRLKDSGPAPGRSRMPALCAVLCSAS